MTRLKALSIANNPGSRAIRMIRGTAHLVDWTLVARAVRGGVDYPCPIKTWSNAAELKDLLEQDWAKESPLWLAAQQLDCEWVPPFVSLCRGPGKQRIVVDVRDMTTLIPKPTQGPHPALCRMEAITLDELSTMRIADGLIHISPAIANACAMLHRSVAQTPTYILPCYVNRADLVDYEGERRGIVYSGGIASPGPTFRAYHDVFEALAPLGLEVYPSPTGPNGQEICDSYIVRGVPVHRHLPFAEVIPALSRHRWGLVGFPTDFPLGHGALPNKTFEYFAAGCPVLVFHADTAGEFVRQNGLGIWVQDHEQFTQLPEQLADDELWARCHANVLALRDKLTMDFRAEELSGFFRRCLKKPLTKPGGLRLGLETTSMVDAYGETFDLGELFVRA